MLATPYHTKACFDAWMQCEDVLLALAQAHRSLSKKITKVVDECALICMSTFHALKSKSVNTGRYALLCIGICEECADICDEFKDDCFRQCALVCRRCSETIASMGLGKLQ